MLASNSLQPPTSGRSRFSKALPSVPGFSPDTTLPSLSPLSFDAPKKHLPLPPRPDTAGRNQEAPFSPLSAIASPTSSASTPTSIKSKMTIPRRPVGAGANQKGPGLPSTPAPERSPAPVLTPARTLNPPAITTPKPAAAYVPPPSPSESLSSILSAYSRSSIGSPVISSEGTASVRDSQQTSSPSQSEIQSFGPTALFTTSSTHTMSTASPPVPPPKQSVATNITAQQQNSTLQSEASLSSASEQNSTPPPIPAKDLSRQLVSSTAAQYQSSSSAVKASSPPRPQIWRRRSINKSKDLPPIAIYSSHGSTASTAPKISIQPDPDTASILTQSTTETIKPLPPLSATKPPPSATGLPGRNVRPAQSKPSVAEVKTEMGSDEARLPQTSAPRSSNTTSASATPPAAGRPPTPEYQKEDAKTPMLATFVSPASPASSPEPGHRGPLPVSKEPSPSFANETSKQLPKIDTGSITRKAITPTTVPDLHAARSVPDLRSQSPSPANAPLPSLPAAAPTFAAGRERRPSDAASIRGREFTETGKFPPRGSSVKPDGRQKMSSSQSLPQPGFPENDPRLVRSNSGNMMYRGRDGTLYPEMKDPGAPDPKAMYFPTHPQGRIPEGTILPAPPLRNSHYVCYQKHRNMGRRVNRQYPLACQTCDKADVEDRHVCTFCQLRICSPCFEKFNAKGRDLKLFMQSVKSPELPNVLTLSSGERPGSALGLQINF